MWIAQWTQESTTNGQIHDNKLNCVSFEVERHLWGRKRKADQSWQVLCDSGIAKGREHRERLLAPGTTNPRCWEVSEQVQNR